ncbi:nucleotidyltransferase family protein [Caldanaerobacter sp.]|uniref:nucleotidyltransferase family protein n=1 Tax=Caldanaerobacter sp. TaxID=2930036 RepID=UPI003C727C0E
MNAVIVAGSTKEDRLPDKAFVKLKGKFMISYVIEALRKCEKIEKIAVVGDPEKLKQVEGIDLIVPQSDNMMENILRGIQPFKNDRRVIILTCDIPFLTGEAVCDFIEKAEQTGADLCYPIIRKEDNLKKFPDARRTYARVKEGVFTGGNIFYINPAVIDKLVKEAKKVIAYRKKPWKLGKLLGTKILFLFLIGRLSISHIEKKVEEVFGIKGKAIISPYPEIGNDVDKEEDVKMAIKYL